MRAAALQILPLPCSFRTGKAEQQMFLLVSHGEPGSSSSPTATLLPSSQEAAAAFAPYASLTKFWDLQDGPVPGMKGFALASSSEGATAFEAVEVWSVRFSAHEKILTAVQPSSGSVHTRIKVAPPSVAPAASITHLRTKLTHIRPPGRLDDMNGWTRRFSATEACLSST